MSASYKEIILDKLKELSKEYQLENNFHIVTKVAEEYSDRINVIVYYNQKFVDHFNRSKSDILSILDELSYSAFKIKVQQLVNSLDKKSKADVNKLLSISILFSNYYRIYTPEQFTGLLSKYSEQLLIITNQLNGSTFIKSLTEVQYKGEYYLVFKLHSLSTSDRLQIFSVKCNEFVVSSDTKNIILAKLDVLGVVK